MVVLRIARNDIPVKRRAFALAIALASLAGLPAASAIPRDDEVRGMLAKRVDEAKQATPIVVGIVAPEESRVVSCGSLESAPNALPTARPCSRSDR